MDGNGRWATQKKLVRNAGHKQGLESLKKIIKKALAEEIACVSFFAFSTENWKRPSLEVKFLINLLEMTFKSSSTTKWFLENGVRFIWNGFENNLDKKVLKIIKQLEDLTKNNTKMVVQIMFNYGSQQKIVYAANLLLEKKQEINLDSLSNALNPYNLPLLDLLIRTSGEQRISNFMLWELAYAEIIFNSTYWPDYDEKQFELDLIEFSKRKRRFGAV